MIESKKVKGILIDLHYLPCLEYFACISDFEEIHIETYENYQKQTFRNRCEVLTTNKKDTLTVPVRHESKKMLYKDVKIDYSQDWIRRHWGCLRSAYGKSPFFEHYAPDLEMTYERRPMFLFDLNRDLLTICLKFLRKKQPVMYTLSYHEEVPSHIFDARFLIKAKKNEENCFFYKNIPYYQTFGNDFVPNLSIVDLLFNQGPESSAVLKESGKNDFFLTHQNEQSK